MKQWNLAALARTMALSISVWAVVAVACLTVGSTGVRWPSGSDWGVRLGPVLLASLIGAALAGAGVAYQAILRNPLADPYLLGVSSGASLAAYLWRFSFAAVIAKGVIGGVGLAMGQQVFAFAGAIASVGIVFALASRRGRLEPMTLLLVGVIVNSVNGAMFLLLNQLFRDMPGTGDALSFLIGGIQGNLTAQSQWVAAGFIAVAWMGLLILGGQLNAGAVSDAEARSLGVRIERLRWVTLIIASLITASAVAVSGPIGFVGLICPHLGRLMVGSDQRRLLPVATGLGAALLALADAASRLMAMQSLAQTLVPVGVLTGLMGGPFFLLLLHQSRRRMDRAEGLA